MKKQGLIFVISGPSGSGKTTLLRKLLTDKKLKNKLIKSVSLTTRPRRSGERNGKDYFFISQGEFQRRLKAKKILEWTRYLDYYYATPKSVALKRLGSNRHLVLCLDLKGAIRIKRIYPQRTVTIFIKPPSIKTLYIRIRKRCSKTANEEIHQRLGLAQQELRSAAHYDYSLINANADLKKVVGRLRKIILGEIEHN